VSAGKELKLPFWAYQLPLPLGKSFYFPMFERFAEWLHKTLAKEVEESKR
jgi:hypothetical protein